MKVSRTALFIILIICFLVQWFVPLRSMFHYLDAKAHGERFLFKVVPRDPYDPFKGRYVMLRLADGLNLDYDAPGEPLVYALFEKQAGTRYARIAGIRTVKPDAGNYVTAAMKYSRLTLPFDRYYLNENIAPKVESAMQAGGGEFHVEVRVKDGTALITGLFINDIPVEEYFR